MAGRSAFLFIMFLALGLAPFSARAMEVVYSKTVYDENANFRSGVEARISKGAAGFSGTKSKRVDLGDFCTATLMDADQAFSLSRMLDIGYITEEEYHFYTNLSSGLEPEQVLFFHQYRMLRLSEATKLPLEDQKKLEKLLESRFRAIIDIDGTGIDPLAPGGAALLKQRASEALKDPMLQLKDASVYVVRGQGWDPYLKRRFFQLPWMKEPEFAHGADFSRIEFPLTFEIGRAAQIDEGKFADLLRLAVVEMAEDARIYGVDPAKVKVYGHARDKAHRILYERTYGLKKSVESTKTPGDWVMEGTLADLLKAFPETKTLEVLRDVEVASNGILSGEKAAIAFGKFRDEMVQALDAAEGVDFQRKPVVLVNDLYELGGFLAEKLVPMGIRSPQSDADVDFINRVLKAFIRPFHSSFGLTPSMMADPIMKLRPMEISRKALRIYNLEAEFLANDPDYVLRTLFGVRELYRKRVEDFYRVIRNGTTIPDPVYAVMTTEEKVRDAALRLGGRVEVQKVPGESYVAINGPKPGDKIRADVQLGDLYIVYFDDVQIRNLIAKRPELNSRSLSLFKKGKWQEKLRLNSGAIHF